MDKMRFSPIFFREETRDDFTVPEMMKRAWAAAMEVLQVIDSVCAANDIRYYAFYGTLLGAIRHGGFIPWDDDIDICMLRADYDRFMTIADEILPDGFVISGIYGKEPRLWEANQEPQGRVIADEKYFPLPSYMNRFHGYPYPRIGIDIFPLDFYPLDIEVQHDVIRRMNSLQRLAANVSSFRADGSLQERWNSYMEYLGEYDVQNADDVVIQHEIRYKIDRLISNIVQDGGEFVADFLYCHDNFSDDRNWSVRGMKTEWFGTGREAEFEGQTIRIPNQPEEVLRCLFGDDYMKPKRFTAEHGYPFYKGQEAAFRKLLDESGIDTSIDEFCRNWHNLNGGM